MTSYSETFFQELHRFRLLYSFSFLWYTQYPRSVFFICVCVPQIYITSPSIIMFYLCLCTTNIHYQSIYNYVLFVFVYHKYITNPSIIMFYLCLCTTNIYYQSIYNYVLFVFVYHKYILPIHL